MQIRQRIFNALVCKFYILSYINFAKFWHITCISTTNRRKVINSEKQSGFFGPPCMSVSVSAHRFLWFCTRRIDGTVQHAVQIRQNGLNFHRLQWFIPRILALPVCLLHTWQLAPSCLLIFYLCQSVFSYINKQHMAVHLLFQSNKSFLNLYKFDNILDCWVIDNVQNSKQNSCRICTEFQCHIIAQKCLKFHTEFCTVCVFVFIFTQITYKKVHLPISSLSCFNCLFW